MRRILPIFLFLIANLQATVLKFENSLQEAHVAIDDTEVVREFKFTNTGSKEISIRNADAGCSCIGVEFLNSKSTYTAGETGVMRVTFKIENFQGIVDKTVLIWLADDPDEKPSSQATLRIHIPIAISLEPKTLNWEQNASSDPKSIRVKIDHGKPVHVISASSSSENFSTEIVTLEKGKSYDIRVTPKSTATLGICVIRIETDIDIEKFKTQQGFARIVSPNTEP